MIEINIDYRFKRHITGSVVALTTSVHNIKISFLYNLKNIIGYCLAINLNTSSNFQEPLTYIVRFIDKSHTNGKPFNMVTLNLVNKDGKELDLLYLID